MLLCIPKRNACVNQTSSPIIQQVNRARIIDEQSIRVINSRVDTDAPGSATIKCPASSNRKQPNRSIGIQKAQTGFRDVLVSTGVSTTTCMYTYSYAPVQPSPPCMYRQPGKKQTQFFVSRYSSPPPSPARAPRTLFCDADAPKTFLSGVWAP